MSELINGEMVREYCGTCEAHFDIPFQMYLDRQIDGKAFYCPGGHEFHYEPTGLEGKELLALREKIKKLELKIDRDESLKKIAIKLRDERIEELKSTLQKFDGKTIRILEEKIKSLEEEYYKEVNLRHLEMKKVKKANMRIGAYKANVKMSRQRLKDVDYLIFRLEKLGYRVNVEKKEG